MTVAGVLGGCNVAHLDDPRLGLRPGFEFHIDDLHSPFADTLNGQRVERTRGRAIQHLAGRIVDTQVAGTEKDLSEHLVCSPFICRTRGGGIYRKMRCRARPSYWSRRVFPVASRNSISFP